MDAHFQITANEEFIDPVCEFTYSWCLNCGLSKKASQHFAIAVSELVTDIILFAYPDDDSAYFDITFQHTHYNVELIVSEVGEPFDPDRHKYDPEDALQNGNFEGAGFRLIRAFCDEFLFINKGKEGKEFRLSKELDSKVHPIDKLLEEPALKQQVLTEDEKSTAQKLEGYTIDQIKPSDAEDISKLIYRTYHYTYSKEDVYFPKKIEKAVSSRERLGVITRRKNGDAIGYFAVLKKPDSNIAEVGEAVVSPDYRRQGIMGNMMQHLIKIARNQNLSALFGEAVTVHPVSQIVNAKFGFKSTGLMLASTTNVMYKGFDEDYPQPVSVVIEFLPLSTPNHTTVYLPDAYENIILKTYKELDIEVTPKKPPAYKLKKQSDIHLDMDYTRSTAHLIVYKYGSDFQSVITDMLQSLEKRTLNTVYLDLPLQNPATPDQYEKLKDLDFIYCGLIPRFHHDKDFVRLQKVYASLDFSLVKIHSDFGKEIKAIIHEEYHKNR